MRFLVDSGIPPRLCVHLRNAGHDAVHIDDLDAEDHRSVIATAAELGRVVISRDQMLEIEAKTITCASPPIILLQDLPEDPDTLGRYLPAVFTPSAQALITIGSITHVHSDKITFTGISP